VEATAAAATAAATTTTATTTAHPSTLSHREPEGTVLKCPNVLAGVQCAASSSFSRKRLGPNRKRRGPRETLQCFEMHQKATHLSQTWSAAQGPRSLPVHF